MDELRVAVSRIGGISLLIIDPIITAVTGDMHKANDVRRPTHCVRFLRRRYFPPSTPKQKSWE
jgi:hypothetical protein